MKKIKIAVIDSGFDFFSKLNNDIVISKNFTDEEFMIDKNGHGSCIIKLINHFCNDIDIYNFKVLKLNNKGSLSWLKMALKMALECNIDIINLSLGFNLFIEDRELNELIDKCIQQNIIIVNTNSNSDEKNELNKYKNIINVQGASTLDKDTLYYSAGNFYIDNTPRIVPWINDSYIVTSANSFLTPYMVKYVCNILSENILPINKIYEFLIESSVNANGIKHSHVIRDIDRQNVIDETVFNLLLEKIKKLNLYANNGTLKIKNLNQKSITELVRIIEEITLKSFIIDSFTYSDIVYVENLSNRIINLL